MVFLTKRKFYCKLYHSNTKYIFNSTALYHLFNFVFITITFTCCIEHCNILTYMTSRMDGEWKKQGWLRLRLARGQSPGHVGPICKYTVYTWDSSSTYIYVYIYGNPAPAVELALLANYMPSSQSKAEVKHARFLM